MSSEQMEPAAPPEPGESAELFDYGRLRDYAGFVLRSPGRHPLLAAGSFLLVASLAGAAAVLLPDVYQSEATILALRNPTLLRGAEWDAPTRAARETVLRRANLFLLCDQTNLVDKYLQGRSPPARLRAWLRETVSRREMTREDIREILVDTLEDKLSVNVGQEGVVITAQWSTPQIAYELVDAAVQNFLEARYTSESGDLGETVTLIEARAAKIQQELEAAVVGLEKKEKERNRPGPRRGTSGPTFRKEGLQGRTAGLLNAKRQALADLEEFRARRLEELRTQLVQKELTYADRHPEVLITRKSIEHLSQPSPQVEALRAEVRQLERENASIASSGAALAAPGGGLGGLSSEASGRPEHDDVRLALERSQLQLLFEKYASTLFRLDSARMELDLARAAFKTRYSVISPPRLPRGPYKNNTLRRAMAGLIGGIGLAFFASVATDLRKRRVVERWQIERLLGLPVLAEIERGGGEAQPLR